MDCSKIKKSARKIIDKVDYIRNSRIRMTAADVISLSDIRFSAHEILQELDKENKNEQKPNDQPKK